MLQISIRNFTKQIYQTETAVLQRMRRASIGGAKAFFATAPEIAASAQSAKPKTEDRRKIIIHLPTYISERNQLGGCARVYAYEHISLTSILYVYTFTKHGTFSF